MAEPSSGARGASIRLSGVYKIFGPRHLDFIEAVHRGMTKEELLTHNHVLGLSNINLDIPGGIIQVIMGLSGSGKSTLIRHINRLIEPSSGVVAVDGVDVMQMSPPQLRDFRRNMTAMVFQKFALLPHWTVLENASYGLQLRGVAKSERRDIAMRWIERVGLTGFENKYPNQLSGGMQQRVGLARALANDAPVLLMDEAFSALDPLIRVDMQSVLLDIQKEIKKTIVFITHDLDEALRLGDRIAILRDGKVVQKGTAQDIVLKPADEYVANFVKEVNRGRVLMVENVMLPLEGTAVSASLPRLPSRLLLDEALRRMTTIGATDALAVGEDGRPLGSVTLSDVVTAMVTPADCPVDLPDAGAIPAKVAASV
jgi:glycine betaine/proline transport system ATP-binding protein